MTDALEKIAEGREAEIFAWEDGTVLRLMRDPNATEAVERQAHALRAARAAGVAVPAVHGAETVDGRPGLVMERVDGPDMLTLIGRKPWIVYRAGAVLGEMQAQLHEVEAPAGIDDLIAAHRRRIESSDRVPDAIKRAALAALDGLPAGDRLCHGDFHPGNLIETGGEPVIIDWTGVLRGDPTADYVRTDLMIRLGDPPPGAPLVVRYGARFARRLLLVAYRRSYSRHRTLDPALVERWELPVAAYRLVDGIEVERPKLLALLEPLASP